jgi:hypothetical protein
MVVKPLVIAFMVRLFGYDKTTAITVGLHMAQVSEFGLLLLAFGISYGHVRPEILTVVILVLLITFTTSTYYAKYSARITAWLQRRFRSLAPDADTIPEVALQHADSVLYGVEHIDEEFITRIRKARPHLLVIDPDPQSIAYARDRGLPVIVGSLGNEEVLEKIPVENLRLVIATIPDYEQNLFIIDHLRKHNPSCTIVVSTQSMHEALDLYARGASYVHVASLIDDVALTEILGSSSAQRLERLRKQHVDRLGRITARAPTSAVDIDAFVAHVTREPLARIGLRDASASGPVRPPAVKKSASRQTRTTRR